jgi:formylmethanofuran dehydrogenase subunit A
LAYGLAADSVREEFATPVSSKLQDVATTVTEGDAGVYAEIQSTFDGAAAVAEAAQRIADALRKHPQVTIDVGQVMFGQTVTISADTMHQYASRGLAKPRKSVLVDIECEGGCGVVPFRYRKRRFVNALQWAIGLELFLMVDDPSRVFLTTDHPNGGPFTTYPHLLRLLGDRSFRETALAEIHPDAAAASQLAGFDREYGIDEIAMMTRAAPARILGLTELGRLTPGAIADLTVYHEAADLEKMFARPAWFFRHGEAVVRDGQVIGEAVGEVPKRTWTARPAFDAETPRRLADAWQGPAGDGSDFQTLWIDDDEMAERLGTPVATVPTERTR